MVWFDIVIRKHSEIRLFEIIGYVDKRYKNILEKYESNITVMDNGGK